MGAAKKLSFFKEGELIKEQSIESEVLVGRGEDCVIRLDDRAISRRHLMIRPTSQGLEIEKISEFASISVNGEPLSQAVLKTGDVVEMGPYRLRFADEVGTEGLEQLSPSPSMESPQEDTPQEVPEEGQPPVEMIPLEDPVEENKIQTSDSLESLPLGGTVDPEGGVVGVDGPVFQDSLLDSEIQDSPNDVLEVDLPQESELQLGSPQEYQQASPPEEFEAVVDEDGATRITPMGQLKAVLFFGPGSANVTEFEIRKEEISIGRGKNCDVVLSDKKSSRKHILIRRAGPSFVLKDLGSSNGTKVNGVKVQEHELSSGDRISIGGTVFEFKAVSVEYEAQAAELMSVPEEEEVPSGAGSPDLLQPTPQFPPTDLGQDSAMDSVANPNEGSFPVMNPPHSSSPSVNNPLGGMMPAEAGGAELNGIAGLGGGGKANGTLLDRWKGLPQRQRILIIIIGALGLMTLLDQGESPKVTPKKPVRKVATAPTGSGPVRTFESLSREQKQFVEQQHSLAYDLFRNKEYDKSLFEVQKIFQLIPNYKDSREIERYAKEGKRRLEAMEEERRRKEEEQRIKSRIAELVGEAQVFMSQESYESAQKLFPQILALDPENQTVAKWQRTIDVYEENRKLRARQQAIQSEINKNAWDLYSEGIELKNKGECLKALPVLQRVPATRTDDKRLLDQTSSAVSGCYADIRNELEPVLQQALSQEQQKDYSGSYKLYEKASIIDPNDKRAPAGMNRVRGILHKKAKIIYTEGVIAESYSDFATAREKFQKVVEVAPKDDVYFERATRKLSRYEILDESQPAAGDYNGF